MYILIFSAQRECSNLIKNFLSPPFLFLHSISFSFNPNQCTFFYPMQCYFWDVDCVAHNSSVLHFDGVVNEPNDGWYRRFTCAIIIIHAMQDRFLRLLHHHKTKGSQKALEKKHHENRIGRTPGSVFFFFFFFFFLILFFFFFFFFLSWFCICFLFQWIALP